MDSHKKRFRAVASFFEATRILTHANMQEPKGKMGLRTSDIDIVSFILDANFICYINLFIVFIYYVSSIFEPQKK